MKNNLILTSLFISVILAASGCSTPMKVENQSRAPAQVSSSTISSIFDEFQKRAGKYKSNDRVLEMSVYRQPPTGDGSYVEIVIGGNGRTGKWKSSAFGNSGVGSWTEAGVTFLVMLGKYAGSGSHVYDPALIVLKSSDDFRTMEYFLQTPSFEVKNVTSYNQYFILPSINFTAVAGDGGRLNKVEPKL